MAGFARGLLSGTVLGAAALAGLSLALPEIRPVWGGHSQPDAPASAIGPLLVVPDRPAPRAATAPRPVPTTKPSGATPVEPPGAETALIPVPAGSEFARSRDDSAPTAPARTTAPQLADAPLDAPVASPPQVEPAPGAGLDQPGRRPTDPPDLPDAFAAPTSPPDSPSRPEPEAPIPVPPPGEATAPLLGSPAGPDTARRATPGQNVIPPGLTPPPQVLSHPAPPSSP